MDGWRKWTRDVVIIAGGINGIGIGVKSGKVRQIVEAFVVNGESRKKNDLRNLVVVKTEEKEQRKC